MKATIPFIEQKFAEFNQLCFNNSLPRVAIKLSNARSFVGQLTFMQRRGTDGLWRTSDYTLRISTQFDLDERALEDTILHEMIHLYIRTNNIKDTSTHGKVFRMMMKTINERHGRNIKISHKSDENNPAETPTGPAKWHVVAVVSLKNGRTGIKVLPRILQRILNFYYKVSAHPDIKKVDLYMLRDVFFNNYPNSSALKIHYISPEQLAPHLKNGRQLVVKGNTLR